mmetsp:Transcript_63504/g.71868  ORF Transcript_63504/g.71868 Transcript_63504/m.71868 type:complete len:263 (-) Transcript_63504:57-845(-)
MHNGNTWTCNYLQETVQDVDANFLHESERLMCAQAQLQGEMGGCLCSGGGGGAALAPIQSQVSNINPACDLCAGQASAVVPSSNYDKTVATGVAGTHNCQSLYTTLASGTISSTLCSAIQRAAGATCCSSSSGSGESTNNSNNIPFVDRPITNTNTNNNSNNTPFVDRPITANTNSNTTPVTVTSTSTLSVPSNSNPQFALSVPSDELQYNTAGGANGSGNRRQAINAEHDRIKPQIGGPTTNRGGRTGTVRGAAANADPLP